MLRNMTIHINRQPGFSLLEVLMAIVIFAVGMLALASLQGSLTRSAADANLRTVASNIAEEIIEYRRGFARIATDPDGAYPAYADIVGTGGTVTINRGGIDYSVDVTVEEYAYDLASDRFVAWADRPDPSVSVSDYKLLTVTVAWDSVGFRTAEGQDLLAAADLNTGSVTLSETISSVTSAASSKALTQETRELPAPVVDYSPGERPDIVSLSLGDNRFKESLLPEPDIVRSGDLVETRFDVVTYAQADENAQFLRREEFIAITCECELRAPSVDPEAAGRRPTVWAGDEYAEGHFVAKPYGVPTSNQQSPFCDVCCRDHHDGGASEDDHLDTAVNLYDPFRPAADYHAAGSFNGDHRHYARVPQVNAPPVLVSADGDGDEYLEACRLVRKDGFFRVAQDFRQEDLHAFPEDFLDEQSEVDTYSAYVTAAAANFENAATADYEAAPPCIGGPAPCVAEPVYAADYPVPRGAGEFPRWTPLPLNGQDQQQLRARGVYIDYLSGDIRTVLDCLRGGDPVDSCQSGDVTLDQTGSGNILEIIPFFDVQLTWLFRWNETPTNIPVETTNQGLEDDNAHLRGNAKQTGIGCSDVEVKGHRGNLGFTDSAPIDDSFTAGLRETILDVEALDETGFSPCVPLAGDEPVVSGAITETLDGVMATDVEVEGLNGVQCDRTPTGFECTWPPLPNPTVRVFGYGLNDGIDRYACMLGDNRLRRESQITFGLDAYAIFKLSTPRDPQPDGPGYDINVQTAPCP